MKTHENHSWAIRPEGPLDRLVLGQLIFYRIREWLSSRMPSDPHVSIATKETDESGIMVFELSFAPDLEEFTLLDIVHLPVSARLTLGSGAYDPEASFNYTNALTYLEVSIPGVSFGGQEWMSLPQAVEIAKKVHAPTESLGA